MAKIVTLTVRIEVPDFDPDEDSALQEAMGALFETAPEDYELYATVVSVTDSMAVGEGGWP